MPAINDLPALDGSATQRPSPQHRLLDQVRRHPLVAFLIWAFAGSQAFAFTPVIARASYGLELPSEPFLIAGTVFGLLLPTLVITRVVDGGQGLRELWSRMIRFNVAGRWYALALVAVPVTTIAITGVAEGLPADLSAPALTSALASGLLHLAVVWTTVNLWEEVAWTGFVQARLQARHRPLVAALITSPFFTLQHLSLTIDGTEAQSSTLMAIMFILIVPYRALAGWVYNRTHSLLIVGLIHAAGNATALGSLLGADGLVPRLYGQPGQSAVAFGILGVLAIAVSRGRLGRERHPDGAQ